MKRKVKRTQFLNAGTTMNINHNPKNSLDHEKDKVDMTLTECGLHVFYKDSKTGEEIEKFQPIHHLYDVWLLPEVDAKKAKTA